MNLAKNNIITIENKVRHIFKSTNMKYVGYEFKDEEVRTYTDGDNEYDETFNAEIYINVDGDDKKFDKVQQKLSNWTYKKFDGLILYLNVL